MRIHLFSVLFLMILVPVKSIALEPVNEAHAMFYFQVPFSADKAEQKKHSFGFRMDHTTYDHGEMIQYQQLMKRPAAFDFKMGYRGVEGVYVSGVDYLQRFRLLRAAEGEEGGEDMEAGDEEVASTPDAPKKPGTISKVGNDVSNTVGDLISIVPLGFWIGGTVAVVLVAGIGG